MEVRGREIHFLCTVEAHHKISALSEDKNVDTVLRMLRDDSNTIELYTLEALFTVAMSEGYEANRHWEDPTYTPNPLTLDEINHLVRKDFDALFAEAIDKFIADIGVSIETEEQKGKKAESGGAGSGST